MNDDYGTIAALSRYRMDRALDTLLDAKDDISKEKFYSANNRIYYAIFYAICSVHALDNRETKSHQRAIGEFNRFYIHSEIFPLHYGKHIKAIYNLRRTNDYDDFYVPNAEETKTNYDFAEKFVNK